MRAGPSVGRAWLVLSLAVSVGGGPRAFAEQIEKSYALEVNLFTGYNRLYLPTPAHRGEVSQRDGGIALGIGAAMRSKYFLSPFVDVNYHFLLRSTDQVDLGPALGGVTVANNFLSAVGVVGGVALDVWRLRFRGGVALDFVLVHSSMNGSTLNSNERDMGYFLGLAGYVWRSKRFKVGIEARTTLILNANIGFVSLGITGNGDAFKW